MSTNSSTYQSKPTVGYEDLIAATTDQAVSSASRLQDRWRCPVFALCMCYLLTNFGCVAEQKKPETVSEWMQLPRVGQTKQ
jgi:hypothetical protein